MPNHVTHRVKVRGAAADVAAFKTRCILEKTEFDEFRKQNETWTLFDFNALIPMPEVLKNTQSSSAVSDGLAILGVHLGSGLRSENTLQDMLSYTWVRQEGITTAEQLKAALLKRTPNCVALAERAIELFKKTGHADWYSWSNANWGTKWNCYAFGMDADQPEFLEFHLDTAWATPLPIWEKVAQEFPKLVFEVDAFDEGWNFAVTGAIDHGVMGLRFVEATDEAYEKVHGHKPVKDDEE